MLFQLTVFICKLVIIKFPEGKIKEKKFQPDLCWNHYSILFHFHSRNILLSIRFLRGQVMWLWCVLAVWCRTVLCGCWYAWYFRICSKGDITKLGFFQKKKKKIRQFSVQIWIHSNKYGKKEKRKTNATMCVKCLFSSYIQP